MKERLNEIAAAVADMNEDGLGALVQQCLDEGVSPMDIIEHGLGGGLEVVGRKFEEGEYFLADLIMAGTMVTDATEGLKSRLSPGDTGAKGKILLATVQGDIHDIGKNIVGMILSASGYEVIDMGVDVPVEKIVEEVKKSGVRLIGLSVLLTTLVERIREVVDRLGEAGLRDNVRIAIGGACCSQRLADEMGVDGFGESAISAVGLFDGFRESLGAA